MKKESTRYLTSVTLHTSHFLANLLALKKILGMPIDIAKPIAKSKPSEPINLVPYFQITSKLSTDDLKAELDEYEIEITVINQ